MKKQFFILIITILLSCTTTTVNEEVDLNDLIAEEIENSLIDSNLFKAYQMLTYYELTKIDNQLVEEKMSDLYKLFPEQLEKSFSDGDWQNFFLTFNNLNRLGFNLTKYNINDIYLKYILDNCETKLYKSAIFLSEQKIDYSLLTNEELRDLYSKFKNITHDKDYPLLINELDNRAIHNSNNDSSNYVDGVMTIFVNKGISFENGVGTQDIEVGSGFFIDKKGHAVTNYHVIEAMVDPEYEGVSELYIKLNGEVEKIPATVVGWDPILDLALIKIPTVPQYIFSFNNNRELKVGEDVIAIGSPGGLGNTVTSGIVSAKNRRFLEIGSVVQIDSPINPGNSGGPLIDENRDVSNIVYAGIESFEGVNFAIPVEYLYKSLDKLYRGGERKHVWLGAGLTKRMNKLEVTYVKPKSPAFYIGLKKGDIIKSINDNSFDSIVEYQNYLMDFNVNEFIEVDFLRDGREFSSMLCLEERPVVAVTHLFDYDTKDKLYSPIFGMDIEFNGKILWDKEYLIKDVYPGTYADEMNLKSGDIVKIKSWQYNDEYEVVIIRMEIQSYSEGFWAKTIQLTAPVSVNLFI